MAAPGRDLPVVGLLLIVHRLSLVPCGVYTTSLDCSDASVGNVEFHR